MMASSFSASNEGVVWPPTSTAGVPLSDKGRHASENKHIPTLSWFFPNKKNAKRTTTYRH